MCGTCGNGLCNGCGDINVPTGPQGNTGNNGWSPQFSIIVDPSDSTREVLQLIGWTGGTGAAPGGVNMYLGSSGLVSTISSALNVRGSNGTNGTNGSNGTRFMCMPIFDGQTKQYIQLGGGNPYVAVVRFIYPGTTSYGRPSAVLVNIWRGGGSGNVSVQLYDVTNSTAVTNKTTISSSSTGNIELINDSSSFGIMVWPSGQAVIEIQIAGAVGAEVAIGSVTLIFP